jgi:serine/threonine protein kinase
MNEHQVDVAWEPTDSRTQAVTIGRYLLHRQIARGGMATIHIARLMGDEGFSRIVAAKRLLPEFAEDAEFVAMFLDEARIASKVHHANVVPVLDVVTTGDEVILVQEYVHGAPLHLLLRTCRQQKIHIPVNVAVAIACQVLAGLHAAHETVDELGEPLNVVHRDVSPQNVMISVEGIARLLDFGVAKATMAAHVTRDGTFKGKLAYSAPEQLRGHATKQSDIYAASVLLWELLVGRRMHQTAQAEAELVATIMGGTIPSVTEAIAEDEDWETIDVQRWHHLQAIEPIVKTGLATDARNRWATASDMEQALLGAITPASRNEISAWLKSLAKEFLDKHDRMIAAEEASWRRSANPIRRTPVPGELRRATLQNMPAATGVSGSMATTSPRSSKGIIGVLLVLVVALTIGIVIAVQGPNVESPKTATPAPAPAAEPAPPPAPAAAVPPPVEAKQQPPAATVQPPPPVVDPPIDPAAAKPAEGTEARTTIDLVVTGGAGNRVRPPPKPVGRQPPAITRQAPPAAKQPPATKAPPASKTPAAAVVTPPATGSAAPPPPPAAGSAAPAKATNECTPPYYFDGNKKIFKPQCL